MQLAQTRVDQLFILPKIDSILSMFNTNETPLIVRKPKAILLDMNRTVTTRNYIKLVRDPYLLNTFQWFLEENYLEMDFRDKMEAMRDSMNMETDPSAPRTMNIYSITSIMPFINSLVDYFRWAMANNRLNPCVEILR